MHKDKLTTWCERNKTILEYEEQKWKVEWINNMKKELQGLEEGPEVDIHLDLLKRIIDKLTKGQESWWLCTRLYIQEMT